MRDPETPLRPWASGGAELDPGPTIPDRVERVVLAIDFARASLGAARWAVSHLARRDAMGGPRVDACVAHVVPWPAEGHDAGVAGAALHGLRPALMGGLAGVAASLRIQGARPAVRIGRPSVMLAALVEEQEAQLLVLGRRRDAARSRIGEPNVIERVARRAGCDVLVVPEGATGPVAHVVAAVDASPWAAAIVARALAVARAQGASLTMVHVLSPFQGSYDRLVRPRARTAATHGAQVARDVAARQDAALAWLASLMRDADPRIACQLSVPVGDAARALSEVAARGGPAMIVLGKRGADETPAGSLGSVARELALRGPVPVLALRCDDGEDTTGEASR